MTDTTTSVGALLRQERDRARTELGFLAARHERRRDHRQPRCTGISSDALAWYGVRYALEPSVDQYPADQHDLAACERTYEMAPEHVQARMLPVLEKYRAHLAERRTAVDTERLKNLVAELRKQLQAQEQRAERAEKKLTALDQQWTEEYAQLRERYDTAQSAAGELDAVRLSLAGWLGHDRTREPSHEVRRLWEKYIDAVDRASAAETTRNEATTQLTRLQDEIADAVATDWEDDGQASVLGLVRDLRERADRAVVLPEDAEHELAAAYNLRGGVKGIRGMLDSWRADPDSPAGQTAVDRCFITEVDGESIRVQADRSQWTEETQAAFIELVRAAKQRHAAARDTKDGCA